MFSLSFYVSPLRWVDSYSCNCITIVLVGVYLVCICTSDSVNLYCIGGAMDRTDLLAVENRIDDSII